jgi:hypothetical protein
VTRDTAPSHPTIAEAAEDLDPELLALPDPPKKGRTLTLLLLGLTAIASLAMVFALRRDVAYAALAFRGALPADVGDLHEVDGSIAGHENGFVSARGMLGAAGGIRYERPFASDSFRALPVAGRPDVWVEVRIPAGQESGRWEPPRSFSGRLVRFHATGPRHRGLSSAIASATAQSVPDDAWLLVDGEAPSTSRWSAALALLFFGFAVWNVGAIAKLVRRVEPGT